MKFLPDYPVDTPANRIKYIRKSLDISQKEMAEIMGISQSTLSQVENAKYDVSFESMVKLSEAYNINCNWLVLGIENIFLPRAREERDNAEKDVFKKNRVKKDNNKDDSKGFPLVDADAIAGYIENFDDEVFLGTLEVYRLPGFVNNGDRRIFQVQGDSMQPTFYDEDFLVCDLITEKSDLKNGDLVVVVTKEAVLVKRLFFYEQDRSFYVLKSDNPDYDSLVVEITKISEIRKVTGRLTSHVDLNMNAKEDRILRLERDLLELKAQMKKLLDL